MWGRGDREEWEEIETFLRNVVCHRDGETFWWVSTEETAVTNT